MKSVLRSTATSATLLLASLGALVAAQPAAAQQAHVYVESGVFGQPPVDRFEPRHDWRRDHGWRRDHRAPQIVDVTPNHGDGVSDHGLTRIAARFRDNGSGIASVTLRVDGRDVTGRARIDSDEVRYRENLQPGRHMAELVVRDRAGNVTRRAWNFDVIDSRYGLMHGAPVGLSRW